MSIACYIITSRNFSVTSNEACVYDKGKTNALAETNWSQVEKQSGIRAASSSAH